MEKDFVRRSAGLLTLRDYTLLQGLFESRVMTSAHIAWLYFDGRAEAAKKRLQKLCRMGYVVSRRESHFERALFSLTSKSIRHLKESGALSNYPPLSGSELNRRCHVSRFTLLHELEVLDFKTSVTRALRAHPDLGMAEFGTWPRLYEFESVVEGRKVAVKPDGYLSLIGHGNVGASAIQRFLVEVDRSTESLRILVDRVGAYQHHYRSGDFARSHGSTREDFRDLPFRVLVIVKSAERAIHLAEELLHHEPPVLTFVLLTTENAAMADPLGHVWIRPLDCRDIAKSRSNSPRHPRLPHRNHSRGNEQSVWTGLQKISLLD